MTCQKSSAVLLGCSEALQYARSGLALAFDRPARCQLRAPGKAQSPSCVRVRARPDPLTHRGPSTRRYGADHAIYSAPPRSKTKLRQAILLLFQSEISISTVPSQHPLSFSGEHTDYFTNNVRLSRPMSGSICGSAMEASDCGPIAPGRRSRVVVWLRPST